MSSINPLSANVEYTRHDGVGLVQAKSITMVSNVKSLSQSIK